MLPLEFGWLWPLLPRVGPPGVPGRATRLRDHDPTPGSRCPWKGWAGPAQLLKLKEEGKALKTRGQMGQLVTATRAAPGSGLAALPTGNPIFSGEQEPGTVRVRRGWCGQPSSTPRSTGRAGGAAPGLGPSVKQRGPGWDAHPCHGAPCGTARVGGSFSTGSAPNPSHPWHGGAGLPQPGLASAAN